MIHVGHVCVDRVGLAGGRGLHHGRGRVRASFVAAEYAGRARRPSFPPPHTHPMPPAPQQEHAPAPPTQRRAPQAPPSNADACLQRLGALGVEAVAAHLGHGRDFELGPLPQALQGGHAIAVQQHGRLLAPAAAARGVRPPAHMCHVREPRTVREQGEERRPQAAAADTRKPQGELLVRVPGCKGVNARRESSMGGVGAKHVPQRSSRSHLAALRPPGGSSSVSALRFDPAAPALAVGSIVPGRVPAA